MKHTCITTLAALLGGVVVGSAVTMLLTPKSGPEMRDSLKDLIDKEITKIRNFHDKECCTHQDESK